jgi:hypothetical protein
MKCELCRSGIRCVARRSAVTVTPVTPIGIMLALSSGSVLLRVFRDVARARAVELEKYVITECARRLPGSRILWARRRAEVVISSAGWR